MRTTIYLILMALISIIGASLTVEVYRACGEGWWWKGKDWCSVQYLEKRLQPPPPPAEQPPAPPSEPKPPPKPKAKTTS